MMARQAAPRRRLLALAALLLLALACVIGTVEGIRRVPPAEETQRRLAEEEGAGAGAGGKEWCLEAGFDPEKLKCATCDKLAGVVLVEDAAKKTAGEALVAECKQCCQAGGSAAKYARAVLECDGFFLKFLEPFKRLRASDEAKAWVAGGTLAFETKTGVRPSLHLFAPGEEKEPSETVSVASWTAESMLEFLLDSLPAPATKTSGGSGKEEGEGGAGSHEEL